MTTSIVMNRVKNEEYCFSNQRCKSEWIDMWQNKDQERQQVGGVLYLHIPPWILSTITQIKHWSNHHPLKFQIQSEFPGPCVTQVSVFLSTPVSSLGLLSTDLRTYNGWRGSSGLLWSLKKIVLKHKERNWRNCILW